MPPALRKPLREPHGTQKRDARALALRDFRRKEATSYVHSRKALVDKRINLFESRGQELIRLNEATNASLHEWLSNRNDFPREVYERNLQKVISRFSSLKRAVKENQSLIFKILKYYKKLKVAGLYNENSKMEERSLSLAFTTFKKLASSVEGRIRLAKKTLNESLS